MEVGETIKYRGYSITRHLEGDFTVTVGEDTLEELKDWIDRLIDKGDLDDVEK